MNNPNEQDLSLPQTLTRKLKLTGRPNYNNIEYLKLNQELENEYKAYIFSVSPLQLLKSYRENIQIYFAPSSIYPTNIIVERLPWRSIYEQIFSAPILYILIFLLGAPWLLEKIISRDYLASFGILLPGIFIFAVCVLFEKGENARFKFFLEPVLFVFLSSQIYSIGKRLLTSFAPNAKQT